MTLRAQLARLGALGLAGVFVALGGPGCATSDHVLTAADRGPLGRVEHDGRRWLVHRALGFELLDPGDGFAPDAAMAAELTRDAGEAGRRVMQGYTLAKQGQGALMVLVSARQSTDEHDVDSFLRGVADGFRQKLRSAADERRSGSGMGSRIDLRGEVQGVALRTRVLFVRRPRSDRYVALSVSIVPADEPALVRSLESTRALPAPPRGPGGAPPPSQR